MAGELRQSTHIAGKRRLQSRSSTRTGPWRGHRTPDWNTLRWRAPLWQLWGRPPTLYPTDRSLQVQASQSKPDRHSNKASLRAQGTEQQALASAHGVVNCKRRTKGAVWALVNGDVGRCAPAFVTRARVRCCVAVSVAVAVAQVEASRRSDATLNNARNAAQKRAEASLQPCHRRQRTSAEP